MANFVFVDSILQSYLKEEVELEGKLNAVREKYKTTQEKEERSERSKRVDKELQKAVRRNKAFIKDLELAAAKLRTQSCYSPTEVHLEKEKKKYIEALTQIRTRNQMIEQPEHLTWLDLSFNRLTTVAPELASFPALKILYLHGNHLSDLASVLRPLKCLEELYSLTLHGNPLEERKGYRSKVLFHLPQLKSLDFSNITTADHKRMQMRRDKSADLNRPKSHF